MANKLLLKKSSTAAKVPLSTDLDYGELAINYTDEKIYFKNASNAIKSVGTVTSVDLSVPSIFSVSNNPVTTSGTLTVALATQTTNTFFAGPNGSTGAPTFRSIVVADLPTTYNPATTLTLGSSGVSTSLVGNISATTSNQTVTLSPTGASGTVTIAPGTLAGSIDNMNIGATTRGTGAFTTLSANNTVSIQTSTNNQTYSTTSTGTISISSGTTGSINNMTIGGTTPAAGTFTQLSTNTTNVSSAAWTTTGINFLLPARTYTDTSSVAGTVPSIYANVISTPSFAATNAITITDAVNLYVAAAGGGTNTTLTNAWSIYAGGRVRATDFTGTIGATTASAGTFTQITVNGSNVNTSISPTGTGTVTINPAGAISITGSAGLTLGTSGQTTTMAGNISATTNNQTVTLSPTGTGTVTVNPVGALTLSTANVTATASAAISISTGTTTTSGTTGAVTIGSGNSAAVSGNVTISTGTGTTSGTLSIDTGAGSTTTGPINIGTGANAKTITVGNATGATSLVFNSGTSGATFNTVSSGQVRISASNAPTTDMLSITNTGQAVTTAGVSSLQMTYVGGAANIEASAAQINLTPGTTSGGIWNGYQVSVGTDATTGVTLNGLKLDTIATPGTGTSNALYAGTGWDNILNYNGSGIINGSGQFIGTLAAETYSTSAAVSAAGTTQGTGTSLTSDYNVITTAAATSGVVLPTATTGRRIIVVNKGANALAVYPATGGTIDALAANAAISIPVNGWMEFDAASTTQWYSSYNITSGSSSGVSSFSAGTTGLTPNTATTGAVTLGGTLGLSNGGTNASLSAVNGGVVYSGSSALGISAAGTSGQILVSAGAAAPAFASFDLSVHAPDSSYKKLARVATVGSNITLAGSAPNTLDGISLAANDRILVKDQTTIAENGLYYVSTLGTGANGTWTRTTDADITTEVDGATVAVGEGTVNGGRRFQTTWKNTDTLGTTAMYWNKLVDVTSSSFAPLQTTAVGLDIATPTDTVTLATGAVTDLVLNSFGARTLNAVAASTYTRASTVYIAGAPTAGTNATITTPYALNVNSGNSNFGGAITATGAITFNTTTNNQSYTTTGAGTITITSGTAGSINNMNIGATTAGTGAFTTLTASGTTNNPSLSLSGTALSSTAWTTSGIGIRIPARTYTDTSSTAGTVAASYLHAIAAQTFASTNAITITEAASLFVAAPAAGTNSTLTGNGFSIVAGGRIKASDFTGTIGATTASAGTFTQITVNGANVNTSISPTGTGTVTISPAGTLTLGTSTVSTSILGNMSMTSSGQTFNFAPTAGTPSFTVNPTAGNVSINTTTSGTISITGAAGLTLGTSGQTTTMAGNISATTNNQTVTLSPTGTGTVTVNPVGALTLSTANVTATASAAISISTGTTTTSGTTGAITVGSGNSAAVSGNVTISTGTGTTSGTLSIDTGAGSTTTGPINIGTGANAKTITVGNVTGATSLVFNSGTSGATFNNVASGQVKVSASAAPTVDMFNITNTGQAVTTAGVSALQVTYVGGAAAVEASAARIDLTPGTTTGGTWNAYRVVVGTAATTGVTANGVKFDNLTSGTGTDNMIYAGTGWDNILNYNGSGVINGSGQFIGTLAAETYSTSAAVSAAGTTQGTGTALTSDYNIITTAAASSGVVLPTATTGRRIIVVNKGANALAVYPATGGTIDALAANAAISIPVSGWMEFNASSTTQWYSSYNITTAGGGGSMVYPGAGIPKSTGSAWGTSYSTSGSGTVVALTTAPALSAATVATNAAVSAAGTSQGTGTALTNDYNVITTAAASSGVVLPTATTGRKVIVVNKGANALAVYPATGAAVDALATNASISIPVNGWMEFNASSTTQWYSTYNITTAGGGGGSATATYVRTPFTATASQTTFSGLTYTAGYIEVYLNGSLLKNTDDYTATNGTSVVLTAGANAGDTIETVAYNVATITGTTTVPNGGTGQTTLGLNEVLLGNGTSAIQSVAPGANGNVLTSNGTTWVSSTPASAGLTAVDVYLNNMFYN